MCLFAPLGPYGAPGLDFAGGMSAGFREEIRVFFAEPERARDEFRAQSAGFAPLAGSPGWWMDRWGQRAGTDAAHTQEWADYLALCHRDGYSGGAFPQRSGPHQRRRGQPQRRPHVADTTILTYAGRRATP